MRTPLLATVMTFALLSGALGCATASTTPARPAAAAATESPASLGEQLGEQLTEQQLARVVNACTNGPASSESAAACMLLGTLASEGIVGERDEAHADAMFVRSIAIQHAACERGHLDACYMLGSMRALKLSTLEPTSTQASVWADATLPPLQRACRGGEGNACELVGAIYEDGKGVPRDMSAAAEAYRHACDHGSARSCAWGTDEEVTARGPANADLAFGPF